MPGKIEDVLMGNLFVEQPEGYYRVRLRSKGPIINTIAKKTSWRRPSLASGANAVMQLKLRSDLPREIKAACQSGRR